MDWDLVKYFITVAHSGSATAAAKTLGVNHATVLRRIEQLEVLLDLKLFVRLQSGYQLTEQGKRLVHQAEKLNGQMQGFLKEAKRLQAQPEGQLSISLPESALVDFSDSISRFSRQYPHIKLDLRSSAENSNLNRLEADIALRLTNAPPESLIGKRITSIHFSAYCSKDYFQQLEQPIQAENCQWLLWSGTPSSKLPETHHPDKLLLKDIDEGQIRLRSNQVAEILQFTLNGLGVSLLEDRLASSKGLIKLPFDNLLKKHRLQEAGLWLLIHKDMVQSEPIAAFRRFLIDDMQTFNKTYLTGQKT